jgi:hypothetical protein
MDTGFGGGETCTECGGFARCQCQRGTTAVPVVSCKEVPGRIIPPQGGSGTAPVKPPLDQFGQPVIMPNGFTVFDPAAAERRHHLALLADRLAHHIDHHLPASPGSVPLERLPLLADVLRTAVEVEAVLAGIETQQRADATTVD